MFAGSVAAESTATYSKLAPDVSPSARFDPPLVYDSAGKSLLLFGGSDGRPRNDLWRYSIDEQRWLELQPQDGAAPPPRFGHTTIYDPIRRRLILFGGQAGGFFSDVWAYDIAGNRWTELAKSGAGPSSRYGHSGIYDLKRDRLVISHGFTDSGRFDDTWSFNLLTSRWTNLTPAGLKPLKRCLHHAAYDEASDRFLLFGGCSSGFGKCPQDDLWSFDLKANVWKQLPGGPPARERYAMAFDSKRGRLLIFGGSGFPLLNDTWSFDVQRNSWTALNVKGDVPSSRSRVEGVYAEGLDSVFWFGGSADAGLSNELFRLDMSPGARIDRVVNAFSGAPGNPVPGELVSLYGSGLDQPVTFGGIVSPAIYTSAAQINTRVPEELSIGTVVTVSAGVASTSVTVAAAHPGLFPAVFHADGTVNSPDNPAAPENVIVLYATGTGSPVSISIGGATAEVLYSGPLAGAPGVVQINVLIPATTVRGSVLLTLAGGNTINLTIR